MTKVTTRPLIGLQYRSETGGRHEARLTVRLDEPLRAARLAGDDRPGVERLQACLQEMLPDGTEFDVLPAPNGPDDDPEAMIGLSIGPMRYEGAHQRWSRLALEAAMLALVDWSGQSRASFAPRPHLPVGCTVTSTAIDTAAPADGNKPVAVRRFIFTLREGLLPKSELLSELYLQPGLDDPRQGAVWYLLGGLAEGTVFELQKRPELLLAPLGAGRSARYLVYGVTLTARSSVPGEAVWYTLMAQVVRKLTQWAGLEPGDIQLQGDVPDGL